MFLAFGMSALLEVSCVQTPCSEQERVPADVCTALDRASDFQIRYSIAAIPNPVRVSFAEAVGLKEFEMAEPGAPWQKYDVDEPLGAPMRRLRSVALSNKYCVLFYENGGWVSSNQAAVFRLSPGHAEMVWNTRLNKPLATPDELLNAIERGRVDVLPTKYM